LYSLEFLTSSSTFLTNLTLSSAVTILLVANGSEKKFPSAAIRSSSSLEPCDLTASSPVLTSAWAISVPASPDPLVLLILDPVPFREVV
jgi:hypothetical protein